MKKFTSLFIISLLTIAACGDDEYVKPCHKLSYVDDGFQSKGKQVWDWDKCPDGPDGTGSSSEDGPSTQDTGGSDSHNSDEPTDTSEPECNVCDTQECTGMKQKGDLCFLGTPKMAKEQGLCELLCSEGLICDLDLSKPYPVARCIDLKDLDDPDTSTGSTDTTSSDTTGSTGSTDTTGTESSSSDSSTSEPSSETSGETSSTTADSSGSTTDTGSSSDTGTTTDTGSKPCKGSKKLWHPCVDKPDWWLQKKGWCKAAKCQKGLVCARPNRHTCGGICVPKRKKCWWNAWCG